MQVSMASLNCFQFSSIVSMFVPDSNLAINLKSFQRHQKLN
jgi:hypothetical protein